MSNYKISLKPLDWFFFGGEQTFDNGSSQSFIAHSNRLPQQTALLGMVRYQLLKQEALLSSPKKIMTDEKKSKAQALVGKSSFTIDPPQRMDFGVIKSLSPVVIRHKGAYLLPMPLTMGTGISFSDHDINQPSPHTSPISCLRMSLGSTEQSHIPFAPQVDFKSYDNYNKLIDPTNTDNTYYLDQIFCSQMKVGITKAQDGNMDNDGFFLQETLRFVDADDTAFVFFLELEDGYELKDDFVYLGAQRSCFDMKVEPTDPSDFEKVQHSLPHPAQSILILSPTFVRDLDTLNHYYRFHWSLSLPFRNIMQHKDNDKTTSPTLQSGAVSYNRSSRLCTFLAPGSVLFYKSEHRSELESLLSIGNLQQIGYNNYHTL